jgi:DNA-binding transcriptional ArsR family regulator
MKLKIGYATVLQEALAWAKDQLENVEEDDRQRLLAMVREIWVGEIGYTIGTLARALGLNKASVERDLEYLSDLGLVEIDWRDRMPELPDSLEGWDDGSVFYRSPKDGEIRVQDHPDLYLRLLGFCQRWLTRTTEPRREAGERQGLKPLIFSLLSEIRGYQQIVIVEPDSRMSYIRFEPHSFEGDPSELRALLKLSDEPEISDLDVRYTRAITRDVRTDSRQRSSTVRVEVKWRTGGRGFAPLWEAVRRAWPEAYAEWERENQTDGEDR